jgi:hypothetical protein
MLLIAKTTLYVTSKDGTSEMNFLAFCNAIKGGLKLEEVEVTTDRDHSQRQTGTEATCPARSSTPDATHDTRTG